MVQDKDWFEVYGKNGKAQLLRHLYISDMKIQNSKQKHRKSIRSILIHLSTFDYLIHLPILPTYIYLDK